MFSHEDYITILMTKTYADVKIGKTDPATCNTHLWELVPNLKVVILDEDHLAFITTMSADKLDRPEYLLVYNGRKQIIEPSEICPMNEGSQGFVTFPLSEDPILGLIKTDIARRTPFKCALAFSKLD